MTTGASDLELFRAQAEAWALNIEERALKTLMGFVELLRDYNESNVVGTKDFSQLLFDHVLDSLSCFLFEPLCNAAKVIDVGSGGGLPGIPLKITEPAIDMALVEATGKKVRFLEHVVEELALSNIRVINARAEDLGQDRLHRDAYDVATARALAPLPTLIEYCIPLVRHGGSVIAMKGDLKDEEVEAGSRAASDLGAELAELKEVKFIPELAQKKRSLVVITKASETPPNYPRRPGVPKKRPLGSS